MKWLSRQKSASRSEPAPWIWANCGFRRSKRRFALSMKITIARNLDLNDPDRRKSADLRKRYIALATRADTLLAGRATFGHGTGRTAMAESSRLSTDNDKSQIDYPPTENVRRLDPGAGVAGLRTRLDARTFRASQQDDARTVRVGQCFRRSCSRCPSRRARARPRADTMQRRYGLRALSNSALVQSARGIAQFQSGGLRSIHGCARSSWAARRNSVASSP